jgi:hypothetical protein
MSPLHTIAILATVNSLRSGDSLSTGNVVVNFLARTNISCEWPLVKHWKTISIQSKTAFLCFAHKGLLWSALAALEPGRKPDGVPTDSLVRYRFSNNGLHSLCFVSVSQTDSFPLSNSCAHFGILQRYVARQYRHLDWYCPFGMASYDYFMELR